MYDFTDLQDRIIDALLVGADKKTTAARMRLSQAELEAQISLIKAQLGVRQTATMVARLRELRANPDMFIRSLRKNPRKWFEI